MNPYDEVKHDIANNLEELLDLPPEEIWDLAQKIFDRVLTLPEEKELIDALSEQLSELRQGCLNFSREELIQRITKVSAPEYKRGSWISKQTSPLINRVHKLEFMLDDWIVWDGEEDTLQWIRFTIGTEYRVDEIDGSNQDLWIYNPKTNWEALVDLGSRIRRELDGFAILPPKELS